MEFEDEIAKLIYNAIENEEITEDEIKQNIEIPKDEANGDYSFPCFKLSKSLKKSPIQIADDIKDKIDVNDTTIEKDFLIFICLIKN